MVLHCALPCEVWQGRVWRVGEGMQAGHALTCMMPRELEPQHFALEPTMGQKTVAQPKTRSALVAALCPCLRVVCSLMGRHYSTTAIQQRSYNFFTMYVTPAVQCPTCAPAGFLLLLLPCWLPRRVLFSTRSTQVT
jgi:hypothetical protein